MNQENFMKKAIQLSVENVKQQKGGPFGAIIVKDNKIIAQGVNRVTCDNDPSAHAEIVAIRSACSALNHYDLSGCELYTSCEPCPMCIGAIYWSRISCVYYGNTKEDAKSIGFDDQYIYEEIAKNIPDRQLDIKQMLRNDALEAFNYWQQSTNKIPY